MISDINFISMWAAEVDKCSTKAAPFAFKTLLEFLDANT